MISIIIDKLSINDTFDVKKRVGKSVFIPVPGLMENFALNRGADVDRNSFLVILDDNVRPLTDPNEIVATCAKLLGEYLAVNRCAYAEVEEDQDTMRLTGNYTQGVKSIVGWLKFSDFGADVLRLMREDKPYVVIDIDTYEPAPEKLDAYRQTEIQAVICVPLHKAGKFVAAMALHQNVPRVWNPSEVELLLLVANRCWESIERARVTRSLRESEAKLLEEAHKKDQFLAMLAHELRNPLAPVRTGLEVLKLKAEDSKTVREMCVLMERQVGHMAKLLDDLLDISRITRGKVNLNMEEIDLCQIIKSAIAARDPIAEGKGIKISHNLECEQLIVLGDSTRITQVFDNLLDNAIKFTKTGGAIHFQVYADGNDFVVEVSDTGSGISKELLPFVFDIFTQADNSLHRSHGGLGLGLSLARALIELHGGSIKAESKGFDSGSKFTIKLPAVKKLSESDNPGKEHDKIEGGGKKVVIIEDNKDSADALLILLDLLGFNASAAHNGEAGLEMVRSLKPEVVLCDIGLPGMDGYAVARAIRENTESPPRLIAVSGYGGNVDRALAEAAGFNFHLTKPVEAEKLLQLLNK
jgi:signal transduction histidine kinase